MEGERPSDSSSPAAKELDRLRKLAGDLAKTLEEFTAIRGPDEETKYLTLALPDNDQVEKTLQEGIHQIMTLLERLLVLDIRHDTRRQLEGQGPSVEQILSKY